MTMTKQEFLQWIDTCPANFDQDGNRVANPTWDIHTPHTPDDGQKIVISFFVEDLQE
jgi:hypothetical protein